MAHLAVTSVLPILLFGNLVPAHVVSVDIRKDPPTPSQLIRRDLIKRASVIETLYNNATGGMYMANVTIGTPPQDIALAIDTGSSDIWVLSSEADICNDVRDENDGNGCIGGTFQPELSSTAKLLGRGEFEIQYEDATGSFGDWITDDFSINGAEIKSLQMGLAYSSTSNIGVMGVGYDTNEAADVKYSNFIDEMVSQGIIPVKAYSLYLNDLKSSTGSILFGGVDTEKYTGSLTSLPIQRTSGSGEIQSFTVALTGVGITGQAGNSTTLTNGNFAEPVLLDSGTTLTYLPDSLAASVFKYFGAVDASSTYGNVYINCDLRTTASHMTVDYSFGKSGPNIKVPISELIFDLNGVYGTGTVNGGSAVSQLQPFARTCAFGIQPAGSGSLILGDTFLRSAYVVYDLKNNQISLAQTNFNSTGNNVVELTANELSIAYVSGLVSPSVASATNISATATGPQALGKAGPSNTAAVTSTTDAAEGLSTTGGSATAIKTSKAAAISLRVPRIDGYALGVLSLAVLFMICGGVGFLL